MAGIPSSSPCSTGRMMVKQSAADLISFIRTRMRMSHIYQPVVIRSLLDSGNVATVRQLALDLLSSDEAQIRYYEDRIKKMPLPVLRRHGIVTSDRDGVVRLNVDRMTFEQRAELRASRPSATSSAGAGSPPGITACWSWNPSPSPSAMRSSRGTAAASSVAQRPARNGSR
jgi:hypothetical protein